MTWAKHVDKSQLSRPLAALAETPLKDPGTVRHLLSRQMREQWARKTIPGVVGAHSSQLLKILHSVSKNTSTLCPDTTSAKIARSPVCSLQQEWRSHGPRKSALCFATGTAATSV